MFQFTTPKGRGLRNWALGCLTGWINRLAGEWLRMPVEWLRMPVEWLRMPVEWRGCGYSSVLLGSTAPSGNIIGP